MSATGSADLAAEGVVLHVRPELSAFAITGGDRLSWLNGMVTQDVGKLAPGAGAYGFAVGKTGRILAELWFLARASDVLVVGARDRMEALRDHLDRHLIMEDAEIGPVLDRGVIFAVGPRVMDAVDAAGGADAARIDFTGRGDSAVIVAEEGKLDALVEALCRPPVSATRVTDAEWDRLRVLRGVPRFGVDYDEQSLPQEASLEKLAVSFSKGCYLGQETVFMVEKRGHAKKRLVRLAVDSDADLAAGAELTSDGVVVGTVTSAVPGPSGGHVAIGSVKHKLAVAGAALSAGARPARVLGLAADGGI